MPTFGIALAFVEDMTSDMKSHTLHLGRKPTPPASVVEIEDVSERFDSVTLEEAIVDMNGEIL